MTKLCPRGKAAAKRKFKVYPSAYANAYASKICAGKIKDPSGVKRKDFRGPKPSKAMGGRIRKMGGGMMQMPRAMYKKGGKSFPDLSGDGKVTMKDILMGRGVVKKPKKKAKGGSVESIFKLAKAAKPSGRLSVDDIKRATPGKPSMTLKKGKLKGVKDAPEERRKERQLKSFDKLAGAMGVAGAIKGGARAMKKAGRLALRGYGKARK